jgi:hypothetical protein
MRLVVAFAVSALFAAPVFADPKPCEELQSEIDAKIRANGATDFTLTVVEADGAEDGQVVGTCENSSKKIVYKRGS